MSHHHVHQSHHHGDQPRDRGVTPYDYRIRHVLNRSPDVSKCGPEQTLWTFWEGSSIPPFERLCLSNFAEMNPTWTVRVADVRKAVELVGELLPPTYRNVTPFKKQSNLFRIAVLAKCGGVYTDLGSLFLRPNTLSEQFARMRAAGHEMQLYHHPWHHDIIVNWYIMAARGSSMAWQWNQIQYEYYYNRTEAIKALGDPLFSSVRGYPATAA